MRKYFSKRMKTLSLICVVIIALCTTIMVGCYEGDPFPDGWFERIFVGSPTTTSIVGNEYGGIVASGDIRSERTVACVTYDGGAALWVAEDGTLEPEHQAVGSFDLTGGAYENLFTSTTPVFNIADSDNRNFIVILSGANFGHSAEIITFIDASNVVVQTFGWTVDFANANFAIFAHPLLVVGDGGRVSMHTRSSGNVEVDSYNYDNGVLFTSSLDAAADSQTAILAELDGNGYSDCGGIKIDYNTGDLQIGDHSHILLIIADETGATSSNNTTEIDFIELLTTDAEAVEKHGIHIGQSFDSALTVSGGVQEDRDHGYEVTPDVPVDRVTGIAPDGTAFLQASASDLIIFDANNDYILIGSDATFEAIDAILVLGANQPINEEYYYSTGAGTWATLITSNTVNGFTQSGTITFNAPAGWALTNVTVPAGAAINNAFYVKIVRTRNNLGAPPVEDYFLTYTTSSTTDFTIRGDGTIRPVEMADAAAPNNSLYFSTTQNKLVYKDNGGVVHDLW